MSVKNFSTQIVNIFMAESSHLLVGVNMSCCLAQGKKLQIKEPLN